MKSLTIFAIFSSFGLIGVVLDYCNMQGYNLPYWLRFDLSPETVFATVARLSGFVH